MSKGGAGPDSVRGLTYSEILEQMRLDGSLQRTRPGADVVPVLPPGEVPRNPANVWNTVDRAPEPPTGEKVDGDDPSGVLP